LPPALIQFINLETQHAIAFFDEATPAGWISLYGELPGGTYFFTNLIGQQTETAQVSWDFTLPGYGMTDLLLFGRDGNGHAWMNLYGVQSGFQFVDFDQIMLHDGADIASIGFYGRTPDSPVPDTGSAFALFSLSLCAVVYGTARQITP
jgi:hypothetical protein